MSNNDNGKEEIQQSEINVEEFAKTVDEKLKISTVLGEATWLMTQSIVHRFNFFVADMEWLILAPIIHGQFKLYRSEGKPAALAVWALTSDEVSKRLEIGLGKMPLKDWTSGDQIWLIDVIAPFGKIDEIVADLKQTSFKGKSFKYHRTHPDGNREVVTVRP